MKREFIIIPKRFTSRAVFTILCLLLVLGASKLYLRSVSSKPAFLSVPSPPILHQPVHQESPHELDYINERQRSRRENEPSVVKPRIVEAADDDLSLYESLIRQEKKEVLSKHEEPKKVKEKVKKSSKKNATALELPLPYGHGMHHVVTESAARKMKCRINGKQTIDCLHSSHDVYMPFKFIEKYFEVTGDLSKDSLEFNFLHSDGNVMQSSPKPYSISGPFLFFSSYVVEMRSRVLLVSAQHGVPVSNQWDPKGYYYAIQIVQYGLSHYSQYQEGQSTDRPTILEDGTMRLSKWETPENVIVKSQTELDGNQVVYFDTTKTDSLASLIVDMSDVESCISFDVKFNSSANSSVSILLDIEAGDGKDAGYYVLTYAQGQFWKKQGVDDLQYGLGECNKDWCKLHRDIKLDLRKFLPTGTDWGHIDKRINTVSKLEVKGRGVIDNIAISKTCHMGHFMDASEWILANQDSKGGWPVPVQRVITTKKLTLPPGWHSAMAQGHGISILVRAFLYTKQERFLDAAAKALPMYNTSTAEGGVKARFLNLYDWYEEYPTNPPLFVLNGFIYSLFGLYDLASLSDLDIKGHEAARASALSLYKSGLRSLEKLLPFFDSGTGTFYDLRHYTISGMEPNRARWEYHSVHIAQLYYLSEMENSTLFRTVADRWLQYMQGKWARHN